MPDTDQGGRRAAARRWARRGGVSLALAAASALVGTPVGVGLWAGNKAYLAKTTPTQCGAGCVTDGSLYFSTDPAMRSIEYQIYRANVEARSAGGGHYKTVVLLDPFTFSPGGTVSQARMTDELAGAFLAQRAANEEASKQAKPRIQLLLANEGTTGEEGAAQAIAQIEALQVPDHITAVAGMGLSVAATQTDAMALAADHLPMFGAVTTGDTFNGVSFPGFYQVVPDVEAQVQALLANVKVPQGQHLTLVSSDQTADIYSGDLQTDFATAVSATAVPVTARLTDYSFSPASGPAALGTTFADDAASVCAPGGKPAKTTPKHPLIVLYAGRAADLPALIQVFQQSEACVTQYVTIVTGSDANSLPASATIQSSNVNGAKVTVEYSDIEDVYQLNTTFQRVYPGLVGPDSAQASDTTCQNQTYDPWAVATYDAVTAAATVRLPAPAPSPTPKSGAQAEQPTPAPLITGAAGQFKFSPSNQLDAPIATIPIYKYYDGNCYRPGTEPPG